MGGCLLVRHASLGKWGKGERTLLVTLKEWCEYISSVSPGKAEEGELWIFFLKPKKRAGLFRLTIDVSQYAMPFTWHCLHPIILVSKLDVKQVEHDQRVLYLEME